MTDPAPSTGRLAAGAACLAATLVMIHAALFPPAAAQTGPHRWVPLPLPTLPYEPVSPGATAATGPDRLINNLRAAYAVPSEVPDAVLCQAINAYHEARNQPLAGQVAVMNVVTNRTAYDTTDPCAVIFKRQRGAASASDGYLCEFNWWCNGRNDAPSRREQEAFKQALALAIGVTYLQAAGVPLDNTNGATCYHAHAETPAYFANKQYTATIGAHEYRRCHAPPRT